MNGTPEERAPWEKFQAHLLANVRIHTYLITAYVLLTTALYSPQPNAHVSKEGTTNAIKLCDYHLEKQEEQGPPSNKGEYAMHPSGDGWYI